MGHALFRAVDREMMARCIELSRAAASEGEFPFASLVTFNDTIIAEATNQVARDSDITRHAELLAVSKSQKVLGRSKLNGCTLYTNVEPCPMCSFPIREARIRRVVFSLKSPLMGGFSRWDLLKDNRISDVMPEAFGPPPEVLGGVLAEDAEAVWASWNPLVWKVIRHRGRFCVT